MVGCLELEILLLGNHEQRPTEKEEEIRGQQRLFHHRSRNTAILQSLQDHVQYSLEVGTYYHCVRDNNQKDIVSSVPSSGFTCSQLADPCLHTRCICQHTVRIKNAGSFSIASCSEGTQYQNLWQGSYIFLLPGEERKTMVHFFYLIILL